MVNQNEIWEYSILYICFLCTNTSKEVMQMPSWLVLVLNSTLLLKKLGCFPCGIHLSQFYFICFVSSGRNWETKPLLLQRHKSPWLWIQNNSQTLVPFAQQVMLRSPCVGGNKWPFFLGNGQTCTKYSCLLLDLSVLGLVSTTTAAVREITVWQHLFIHHSVF